MNSQAVTLSGIIVRGAGQAAYFTGLAWVQQQCVEKLHFQPFPGTLNIQVDENCLALLDDLEKKPAINLLSPDPAFCNAKVRTASLQGLAVAVIIPEESVNIHASHIREIIAPVGLKKTLSLQDGDRVMLTFDC